MSQPDVDMEVINWIKPVSYFTVTHLSRFKTIYLVHCNWKE